MPRPWRVVELARDAGRPDKVLVCAVPVLAVVLSRVAYTWALSWVHPALVLGAWALFVVGLAPTGPGGYWYRLWAEPVARSVYVTVAVAAFGWLLAAAWWALRSLGATRTGVAGRLPLNAAAPLVVGGAVVAAVGLETTLTAWNDQMMILPWGLSRILGLTVHLGIPTVLPAAVAGFGAGLAVVGLALWWLGRRRSRTAAP